MSEQAVIYHGGTVLGLDREEDRSEALAVAGDSILGRGTLAEMRALAGRQAGQVDLEGGCLLPGIVDAHPHAMHMMAYRVGTVDLLDAECFDDIVSAIKIRAQHTPKGEWIVCTPVGEPHYFIRRDYTSLAERRLPDRKVLDAAAPEHPVWIMAWAPRTPNVTAFNTLALAHLGIGKPIPDQVCAVSIEKDGDGQPTGILRGKVNNYYSDDPYWASLIRQLPSLPDDVWTLAGVGGVQACNAFGITGLYEAHAMMPPHIEAYRELSNRGLCSARVVASVELNGYAFNTMGYADDEALGLFAYSQSRQNTSDDRFRVDGVTLSRGGPLSQGYLRMHDPYPDSFGQPTRGKTFLPRYLEPQIMQKCLDTGIRFNMVLGGYRDADEFLESLRNTAQADEIASRDWVLQHCYFSAPAHISEYARYNLHITTSASFVYGKSQRVKEKFPPRVQQDFIAMRRFVESGLNLACGTDWGPDNPWRQMALNETREDAASGHHHLLPGGNEIDRLTSLQSFTRNAARVMRWPGLGHLDPGCPADLVIVDRNPLTVDAEALAGTQVLRTVLGGEAIYDSGAIQGGPVNRPPDAQALIADALSARASA